MLAGDAAFSDNLFFDKNNWDSEVVEAMQIVVSVDIGELGVEADVAEDAQSRVAEVAAFSCHQNDLHEPERSRLRPAAGAESPPH